jgi:hypothetical protein
MMKGWPAPTLFIERSVSGSTPVCAENLVRFDLMTESLNVGRDRAAAQGARPGPVHEQCQGWRAFLRNHAPNIAAMDLFVVPPAAFDLLYVFVIVRLVRRDLVWINVTGSPNRGMDCASNHGGVSLEWGTAVPDPRSRSGLWRSCEAPTASHGDPRQAHRSRLTLAERLCRKTDRINPARVRGPHHRAGRGALAPSDALLRALL